MSEKDIYKNVILYSILLTLILSVISWFLFKDFKIIYGIIAGSLARLIGFVAIIINTFSIITDGKNTYKSVGGYIGRLVFYGIAVYFVLKMEVNVFALLFGFSIVNVVLVVIQLYCRKEGIKDGRT